MLFKGKVCRSCLLLFCPRTFPHCQSASAQGLIADSLPHLHACKPFSWQGGQSPMQHKNVCCGNLIAQSLFISSKQHLRQKLKKQYGFLQQCDCLNTFQHDSISFSQTKPWFVYLDDRVTDSNAGCRRGFVRTADHRSTLCCHSDASVGVDCRSDTSLALSEDTVDKALVDGKKCFVVCGAVAEQCLRRHRVVCDRSVWRCRLCCGYLLVE